MRKIYIIPETEQLSVIKESHLCAPSKPNIEVNGTGEGGAGGSVDNGEENGTVDARKHFNLWDEWDE